MHCIKGESCGIGTKTGLSRCRGFDEITTKEKIVISRQRGIPQMMLKDIITATFPA